MEAKKFGQYLKKLRVEQGYTIRQVEMKTGISNAYLSQIENGKRNIPTAQILQKLAPVYGVETTELLTVAGYIDKVEESDASKQPETIMFNHLDGFDDLDSEEQQRIIQQLEEQAEFLIAKAKKNK